MLIKHKRHKRAKNLTLRIEGDGLVVVTRPWFVPKKLAEIFFQEQREWIQKKIEDMKKSQRVVLGGSREHYLKHKEEARQLICERLEYYNQFYGFKYQRVSVRNQKSRWGSCSQDGNLNFNYKVLFLTKEARDYIVIHELCHLKELNHSHRFWALVEQQVPNYKQLRRKIRGVE